jgi:dimethylglycine dehydrogenase
MGPKARPLLQSVTDVDLSQRNFPWLSAQHIRIAGCEARALRVSYIGESGWEVHAANGQLEEIYDAIVAAIDTVSGDYRIAHYGAFAANAMRLEKGYRAWGLDLTTERTACEAGLDLLVKKELGGREKGDWNMQLLALDINPVNSDAFGGQAVFCGDSCVGIVTSGAYGARVEKSLALAYLREPMGSLNESLHVELLGQRVRAIVLPEPPYDPKNLRMKS